MDLPIHCNPELMIADFEAPRFIAFAEMQVESDDKIDPILDDSL